MQTKIIEKNECLTNIVEKPKNTWQSRDEWGKKNLFNRIEYNDGRQYNMVELK